MHTFFSAWIMVFSSCGILLTGAEATVRVPGAAYFVIHTYDGSTMYRASQQTIYSAPKFYKILLKNSKDLYDCHKALSRSGPFVSFHDQDTYLIEDSIQEDTEPFSKINQWQSMLDSSLKVRVYRTIVYTMQNKLRLCDKRGDCITDVKIQYNECMRNADFKEIISDWADHSQLESFVYNVDAQEIVSEQCMFDSYKPASDTAGRQEDSQSIVPAQPDKERKCLVM